MHAHAVTRDSTWGALALGSLWSLRSRCKAFSKGTGPRPKRDACRQLPEGRPGLEPTGSCQDPADMLMPRMPPAARPACGTELASLGPALTAVSRSRADSVLGCACSSCVCTDTGRAQSSSTRAWSPAATVLLGHPGLEGSLEGTGL